MYFLLVEFEVRVKKTPRGSVIYSLNKETEANKMFIILRPVWWNLKQVDRKSDLFDVKRNCFIASRKTIANN